MYSVVTKRGTPVPARAICVLLFGALLAGCQTGFAPILGGSSTGQTRGANPFIGQLPVVAQWNELMLDAVQSGVAIPTISSHQMFMVSAAMYDAYSMYTPDSKPFAMSESLRRPEEEHTEENQQAAVSQAAYQMLIYLYPNHESINGRFRRYLTRLGYAPTSEVGELPEGVGYASTLATIIQREGDDSFIEFNYQVQLSGSTQLSYQPKNAADPQLVNGIEGVEFNPNHWQPLRVASGRSTDEFDNPQIDNSDSSSFREQRFTTPHWQDVVPFALSTRGQFRAEPPPYFGSTQSYTDALGVVSTNEEAYANQLNEVIEIVATLNDEQKGLIEYWANGPRTLTTPGHWNRIAQGLVERDGLSLGESTQLFFALNAAMLDAGIAAWDTKRWYDYIRPISAIRKLRGGETLNGWVGPNRGTSNITAEQWIPRQDLTYVTPPFPGYVSSHSVFSRAASEVLTIYPLSSVFYDSETIVSQDSNGDGAKDNFGEVILDAGGYSLENGPENTVVLQWESFHEAANQAGLSRVYAGTQIQDSNIRGLEMGRRVGRQSFCKAQEFFATDAYRKLCAESARRSFEASGS